jgi:hypothetical protein
MTRKLVLGIGVVVLAFVVVMTYFVWWPGLVDAPATMHAQRAPIHGGR